MNNRFHICHSRPSVVMPGLGPGIHDLATRQSKDVDGRAKPGHDDGVRGALR
jgi:hypothetical protein